MSTLSERWHASDPKPVPALRRTPRKLCSVERCRRRIAQGELCKVHSISADDSPDLAPIVELFERRGIKWDGETPTDKRRPISTAAYALAGYARNLGIPPLAQRYAEYRVAHPAMLVSELVRALKSRGIRNERIVFRFERDHRVQQYMRALAHLAGGQSLASLDDPTRIQEVIGDASELLELLWRRARFKLGDYLLPDGSPDVEAIRAAPSGVFAGLEQSEVETKTKRGETRVERRWKVSPVSVDNAQALLAKVLNLGHINDPSVQIQVQQTNVVQALGKLSDAALKELCTALGVGATTAVQASEPAQVIEATATPVLPEPQEPQDAELAAATAALALDPGLVESES
jgi:hypothetical protein